MESAYTFEEKINFIKETILKHVQAKYIYLFGSHAYGEPKDDSDIDIYVVIPDEIENKRIYRIKIRGDLADKKIYEIDLQINNESSFIYRKTRSMFESTIVNKGKLIYEYN